MKKNIFLISILIIMIILTGCSNILDKYSQPVNSNNDELMEVEIPSGSTTDNIAQILADEQLIHNELAFKLKVKDLGYDGKLKAGTYNLSQSYDLEEIIEKLYDGDTVENVVKFTIPEGYELREIVNLLKNKGLINSEDEFLSTINKVAKDYKILNSIDPKYNYEGFLFPDTYIVEDGASTEAIVRKMFTRFDEIFNEEYRKRLENIDMDLNEVITLASIIEREAMLDEERKTVSSVFHNRLDINMPLQSCATVQYILEERKENLTNQDTSIDSEYNTYMNGGLPPAPIASPGKKSIEAALFPEDTDYLYFVLNAKQDGSHIFSTNLEDHNKAKQKLKEVD